MKGTKFDKRFFDSTRGRLVTLLRGTTKTVNELAEELELTDNAVRAHLLSLERDGLIKQSGIQRGTRKPHFAYQLTEEAEQLFPKAYDALLNQLITVLKGRLTPLALEDRKSTRLNSSHGYISYAVFCLKKKKKHKKYKK